jgi:hypothetical protein
MAWRLPLDALRTAPQGVRVEGGETYLLAEALPLATHSSKVGA